MEVVIGIIGIFIGSLLSEYFRRASRVESFNNEIFNERLKIHIEMYKISKQCQLLTEELDNRVSYNAEEWFEFVSETILRL